MFHKIVYNRVGKKRDSSKICESRTFHVNQDHEFCESRDVYVNFSHLKVWPPHFRGVSWAGWVRGLLILKFHPFPVQRCIPKSVESLFLVCWLEQCLFWKNPLFREISKNQKNMKKSQFRAEIWCVWAERVLCAKFNFTIVVCHMTPIPTPPIPFLMSCHSHTLTLHNHIVLEICESSCFFCTILALLNRALW